MKMIKNKTNLIMIYCLLLFCLVDLVALKMKSESPNAPKLNLPESTLNSKPEQSGNPNSPTAPHINLKINGDSKPHRNTKKGYTLNNKTSNMIWTKINLEENLKGFEKVFIKFFLI